jgi:hypothetical protein
MPRTVVVERAKAEDRKREAQEAESTTAHRSADSLVGGNFPGRRLSSDRHFSEYGDGFGNRLRRDQS